MDYVKIEDVCELWDNMFPWDREKFLQKYNLYDEKPSLGEYDDYDIKNEFFARTDSYDDILMEVPDFEIVDYAERYCDLFERLGEDKIAKYVVRHFSMEDILDLAQQKYDRDKSKI